MDKKNYRAYSPEFKLEALELLKRGDKSAGQIERELGINRVCWRSGGLDTRSWKVKGNCPNLDPATWKA